MNIPGQSSFLFSKTTKLSLRYFLLRSRFLETLSLQDALMDLHIDL